MSTSGPSVWTRRAWLSTTAAHAGTFVLAVPFARSIRSGERIRSSSLGAVVSRTASPADPEQLRAMVQRGVEVAQTAGASYADARLTRVVQHHYKVGHGPFAVASFGYDSEIVGFGVRALVDGAWGFAAIPLWRGSSPVLDAIGPVSKDAVQQARSASRGGAPPVVLARTPVVTGAWSTPVRVDPFKISLEEKLELIDYWNAKARASGVMPALVYDNYLHFVRREHALATSEGTLLTQTLYESGGAIAVESAPRSVTGFQAAANNRTAKQLIPGLMPSARGWEIFADESQWSRQFEQMRRELPELQKHMDTALAGSVGRYTVVCDGMTMASIMESTIGLATQLDRALGYEADGAGTSFIDDPLTMVGQLKVASPLVTVTGNRNEPGQIGTVKWDDEGVEARQFTLVAEGIVSDFQTTREQAVWLAPYYERVGRPVRSNGCAAAEDALCMTMQHMPNLSLAPSPNATRVTDLIATVKNGIYIERCEVAQVDFQARTGLVSSSYSQPAWSMRRIINGKLGNSRLNGMGLQFDTVDFWKHVTAVGGTATMATSSTSRYTNNWDLYGAAKDGMSKGFPAQMTSHSVSAPAAVIEDQPMISLASKR